MSRARDLRMALCLCLLVLAGIAAPTVVAQDVASDELPTMDTSALIVADIRQPVYADEEGNLIEADTDKYSETYVPSCASVCARLPGGATSGETADCTEMCSYGRSYVYTPGGAYFTPSGILPMKGDAGGLFDAATFGLSTINYLSNLWYTYVPGKGQMPDEDCEALGRDTPCGYRPGDINPYGFRIVSLKGGEQRTAPMIDVLPLAMEYDLLSQSIVMLTHQYPKDDYPLTQTYGRSVLSLLAISENTGFVHENNPLDPDAGDSIVQFCSASNAACKYPPPAYASLPYDYDNVAFQTTAFDTYNQVFYCVLSSSDDAMNSRTLFGIKRATDSASSFTRPADGEFSVTIDFESFEYYKLPDRIVTVTALELSPKEVESDGALSYEPKATGTAKALYAIASLKEQFGPCAPISQGGNDMHCGAAMSADDVDAHNLVYMSTYSKTLLEWDAINPPRCECPSALIQLNINPDGAAFDQESGLMKLGNFILDPSGAEFTILSYLDKDMDGTELPHPSNFPGESLIPTLSGIQSHRPDDQGSFFFFDESSTETGQYNIYENDLALLYDPTVIANQYDIASKFTVDSFPFFVFNTLQDSKAAEAPLSDIYPLETVGARSYLHSVRASLDLGGTGGIEEGRYVCVEQPITCDECKSQYILEIEGILGTTIASDDEFYIAWQTLYNIGSYELVLFTLDEKIRPSDPDTYSFGCPEPCDEYTCDECVRLFNRHCALYITAGSPYTAQIYALNAFGRQQKYISDDNFTISIAGDGFQDDVNNPADMPTGTIELGPVWREQGHNYPGGPLADSEMPLMGSELFSTENPLDAGWLYPNYHNLADENSLIDGESYDTKCDNEDDAVEDKCTRYLVRPRNLEPGIYNMQFALDKAGNYTLAVTLKGILTYMDDEQTIANLGTDIFNSPYLLTVLPGPTSSTYSTADGDELYVGRVGEVGTFALKARDRFGNTRTTGGDSVDIYFKGADYVHASLEQLAEDNTYLTEPLGYVPYANVTDHNNGEYLVTYFLVSRIREKPFYQIDVQLGKVSIPATEVEGELFTLEVLQGETNATSSFALQASQAETGLQYVIAGKVSVFTVQAADKFQNLQAFGGDPYEVTITDVSERTVTFSAYGTTSSTESRKLMTSEEAFTFDDPTGMIYFDSNLGDLGQYKVEYSIYEKGVAVLDVSLNGIQIGPGVSGTPGETGSPFYLLVSAAETFPANCILSGPALEGFVAGDLGDSGLGQYVVLQMRDEFGNEKTGDIEEVYEQGDGANYPTLEFRYLVECLDEVSEIKGTEICEGNIPTRQIEGVDFKEEPYLEVGSVQYDMKTGDIIVSTVTEPIGEGQFRSFFSSNLAGIFELAVELRPINLEGTAFTGNFEPVMGEDFVQGSASFDPYLYPFTILVSPSAPSIAYSELFFYDTPLDQLDSSCVDADPSYGCRSSYDIFYSTLHDKMIKMTATESGQVAVGTDILKGTAGLTSFFGLQLRDAYGNIVRDVSDKGDIDIVITGYDPLLGEEFTVDEVLIYEGDGRYRVEYLAMQTGTYTLQLANTTDNEELFLLTQNDDGLWEQTTERFTIAVEPAATDASFCTASGSGLRGGRTGDNADTLQIVVTARDQLGNKKSTDVGDVAIEEAARFDLYVTLCSGSSTASCDVSTREGFPGGTLADITEFSPTAVAGEYAAQYTPTVDPDLIPSEGAYFLIEVVYNDIPIGGDTDVLSDDGTTFLKLVAQGTTPERVFALIQKDYLGADPTRSIVYTYNDNEYIAGLAQATVGQELTLLIQARTGENFDLAEGGTLQRIVFEIYDVSNTLLVQVSNTWPTPADGDTPDNVVDQMDGTFLVILPEIPKVTSAEEVANGAYDNRIITAGTYYMEVRAAKAGFTTITEEYLLGFSDRSFNPITFRAASTELEYVDVLSYYDFGTRVLEDGESLEQVAGDIVSFFLQSRDRFGNAVSWSAIVGGDNFAGQMIRPSGGANADVPASILDNRNGTYLVEFIQEYRGDYKIYITLSSEALPGSDGALPIPSPLLLSDSVDDPAYTYYIPLEIVPGPRHTESCSATTGTGIPLDGIELKVAEEGDIRILERDTYGNLRDTVSVGSNGQPISFALNFTYDKAGSDGSEGSYEVNEGEYGLSTGDAAHEIFYVAGGDNYLAGYYLIYIYSRFDSNGFPEAKTLISGMPALITVLPADLSLDHTIVYGPGIVFDNFNPGTTRAGVAADLSLQARDMYDNDLITGGEEFLIIVQPLGTGIFSEATFESSATGFYQGSYVSKSSGYMLIQVSRQSQLLPTTQFVYQDPVTNAIEPRINGLYETGLEEGKVVDSIIDEDTGDLLGADDGVVVNILPGPLSSSKSYAQDTDSDSGVILGGDKFGKMTVDGSIIDFVVVPVDIFGQKKTDDDDDQRLEARIVYVMNTNNETTDIVPYTDDAFASKWTYDEDGRWISEITLVREEGVLEYSPDVSAEDGMVPVLVAGYYQIEVEVVKFDQTDPSIVLERNAIGEDGVAPVSPYKFFANPGQSSGSSTSLSFGDDEDTTTSESRRLLLASEAGLVPSNTYDFSVRAGVQKALDVGLSDAFGNPQIFDELRKLDSLVVTLGASTPVDVSPCLWSYNTSGPMLPEVDNDGSNYGCILVHTNYSLSQAAPDYSEEGLQLTVVNNMDAGSFTVAFVPDEQIPAVHYGAYEMAVILNGQHIGSSPYRFRVLPGDIYGPNCELFGIQDYYDVNSTIEIGIRARDQFGNAQITSDEADQFVADMSIVKKNVFGVPVLVEGCTANKGTFSSGCTFPITVVGVEDSGDYAITMRTTTSSEYSEEEEGEDGRFVLGVRYCPNPQFCSQALNVYNPLRLSESLSVTNLPYLIDVMPGETDASASIAFGSYLTEGGVIDQKATFTIEARDEFGNRRFVGGDNFQVIIYMPAGQLNLIGDGPLDQDNGQYTVEFLPTVAGKHSVVVLLGISSVGNSPYGPVFVDMESALRAESTRIVNEYGSLLLVLPYASAGQDYRFYVQAYARDSTLSHIYPKRENNDIVTSTLYVHSHALGPKVPVELPVQGTMIEEENFGTYEIFIDGSVIQSSGNYEIRVRACARAADDMMMDSIYDAEASWMDTRRLQQTAGNGTDATLDYSGIASYTGGNCSSGGDPKQILHSPFVLKVYSGAPDPSNSFAVEFANPGALLNHGNGWSAGDVLTFTVQIRDEFKNNFDIDPLAGNPISLVDMGVSITKAMDDSALPFTEIFVEDKELLGDNEYYISYTGSSGRFMVSLKTFTAGTYDVRITLGGQLVKNGDVSIPINPAAFDITNSYVESSVPTTTAGQVLSFFIRARDEYDNPLTAGGDEFLVELTSKSAILESGFGDSLLHSYAIAQSSDMREGMYTYDDGFQVVAKTRITDMNDGAYRITIQCDRAGEAELMIALNGDDSNLPGICGTSGAKALCSEFVQVSNPSLGILALTFTAGPPVAKESLAENTFNALTQASAGVPTRFKITARDEYRNAQTNPGFNFEVRLKSDDGKGDVVGNVYYSSVATDVGSANIYIGEVVPSFAGNYSLSVRRAGKEIKGEINGVESQSPFAPYVVYPGSTSGKTTNIVHETTDDETQLLAIAGETTNFTIFSRDAFANDKTVGGEEFVINVGPLVQGVSVDLGNGTYDANYKVTGAGDYAMTILVNNEVVLNPSNVFDFDQSAFSLLVRAADSQADKSEIFGVGLTTATAGIPADFKIQTYDNFGNRKDFGGDDILAQVYQPVSTDDGGEENVVISLNVTDNLDGSYTVSYVISETGYYYMQAGLRTFFEEDGGVTTYSDEIFYESMSIPEANPPALLRVSPGPVSLSQTETRTMSTGAKYVLDTETFEIIPKDLYSNNITQADSSDFSVIVNTGVSPDGNIFDYIKTEFTPILIEMQYQEDAEETDPSTYFQAFVEFTTAGPYVVNVKYGDEYLSNPYVAMVIPAQVGISGAPEGHYHYCAASDPSQCTAIELTTSEYSLLEPESQGAVDSGDLGSPEYLLTIRVRDIYGNDVSDSVGDSSGVAGLEGESGCGVISTADCPFRVVLNRPDGLRQSSLVGWKNDMVKIEDTLGIESLHNGIFVSNWKYIRSGLHSIEVSFHADGQDELFTNSSGGHGSQIYGSPHAVDVYEADLANVWPPNSLYSFVDGHGLSGAIAGEEGVVEITTVKYGCILNYVVIADEQCTGSSAAQSDLVMLRRGGIDFNVMISAAEGTDDVAFNYTSNVTDLDDGSYDLHYTIEKAGNYLLNVTMFNEALGVESLLQQFAMQEQIIQVLPAETSAEDSYIEGLPFDETQVPVAGRKIQFNFVAMDRFGNLQEAKAFETEFDSFELTVLPADFDSITIGYEFSTINAADLLTLARSISIDQVDSSLYSASFQPRKALLYEVAVKLDGSHLSNSPLYQLVKAGSIGSTYNQLLGVNGESAEEVINAAQAKEDVRLVLHAYDEYKNQITTGGEQSKFFMEFMYIKDDIVIETNTSAVVDNMDGTYDLTFTPKFTGQYSLRLVVNGVPVVALGESYTSTGIIKSVAADPAKTGTEGPSAESGTAGQVGTFEIQVRDKDGQLKTVGGDEISVSYTPMAITNEYDVDLSGGAMQVTDQSSMVATDTFTPVPGRYTVSYNILNFGQYELSIFLNGEHIRNSPSTLTIGKQLPPVQGSALFSSTATKISLSFFNSQESPIETNRGDLVGLDSCDKILREATVAKLGVNSKCTFVTAGQLDILLGYGASILPNEEIILRNDAEANKILNVDRNSLAAQGSTIVERPVVPPLPTIVVRAPTKLSLCEDFVLDASGSYGAAGRSLRFSYGVLPNVPNDTVISAYLDDMSTQSSPSIFLSKDLFVPDITYTFTVSVTNFLQETQTVRHQVMRMPHAIPQILVEGDALLRVERNNPLFIRANVSVPIGSSDPECNLPMPDMKFQWGFDKSVIDVRGFPLDTKTQNTKTLYVAPGTLKAGETYYMMIEGEVDGQSELNNEAFAVLQVKYSALAAGVSAPSKVTSDMEVVIDASSSFDPDDPSPEDPEDPFGPFTFYWNCLDVTDSANPASCFEDDLLYILSQDPLEPILTIPENALNPGVYTFTITISKEPLYAAGSAIPGRSVQIQKTVTVDPPIDVETYTQMRRRLLSSDYGNATDIPASPPEIRLKPMGDILNANERIAIESIVTSSFNDSGTMPEISIVWEEITGLLDVQLDYPSKLSTQYTNKNLVIRPNALSPGQTYAFRVTAQWTMFEELGSTFDELSFEVNGAPSSGTFEVMPLVGFAVNTRFTLKCNGWEDDGKAPVEYEFRYVDPSNGEEVPLVSRSRNNELTAIIPPIASGASQSNVTLKAYIVDYYNAKTAVDFSVALLAPDTDMVVEVQEDPCTADPCPTYNVTDQSALIYTLVQDDFAIARGTNAVAQMLAIATSVAYLNEEVTTELATRPVIPTGMDPPEELAVIFAQDDYNTASNEAQLEIVLSALSDTVASEQFSKETLDAFGTTYRRLLAQGSSSQTDSGDSILSILEAAEGTGIDPVGASSLLDSASSLAQAYESERANITSAVMYGMSSFLQTADTGESWGRRLLQLQEEVNNKSESVVSMVDKLAKAGIKDAVDGEDAFSVSSENLQLLASRKSDPNGTFELPVPEGQTSSPSFDIPTGLKSDGDVDIISSANSINPYQGDIVSTGKFASSISSSVASFDLKAGNSKVDVSIDTSAGNDPITIKIPVQAPSSSCRKVETKCRFWNETLQEWSTEGLYEVERTDEYLICQTIHLSSFAVSTDDIVPEFNVVDPFDLDLFSQLTLDNALAMFIVGTVYVLFAIANYAGYRVDIQKRKRSEVEQKIVARNADLDSLYNMSKGLSTPAPVKSGLKSKEDGEGKDKDAGGKDKSLMKKIGAKIFKDSELVAAINVKSNDTFTRPQRLTVLMAIILGYYASSAIFFGIDPSNIGAKVIIGIVTALIIGPAKTMFKLLFSKSTYVPPKRKTGVKRRLKTKKQKALARGELCNYFIKVKTSDIPFAGTHKPVSLTLFGENGRSVVHTLDEDSHLASSGGRSTKLLFERNELSTFQLLSQDVGKLLQIEIGHDGKGWGAGWHLDHVSVTNGKSKEAAKFSCGMWLDKKLDGGYCERILDAKEYFTDETVYTPLTAAQISGTNGKEEAVGTAQPSTLKTANPQTPPTPASGVGRPRRRRLRVSPMPMPGYGAGNGAPVPFNGAIPAPPPLMPGQQVRPRRIRSSAASMIAVRTAAAFRSMGSLGGSQNRVAPMPAQARDEFGAPVPLGQMPPAPPQNLNTKRRPRRTKSRQSNLGSMGSSRISTALSESVDFTQMGGPAPAPPPKASGAPRPRRRAGKRTIYPVDSRGETPMQSPRSQQDFSMDEVMGVQSPSSKQQRPRPAAQPAHHVKRRVLGALVPHGNVGSEASERAATVDASFYVPPAIDNVVRKIQRRWKQKFIAIKRKENKAATKIQAHWRGYTFRKERKEERAEAQNENEIMSGLWWVKAHTQGKVIADKGAPAQFGDLAEKWASPDGEKALKSLKSLNLRDRLQDKDKHVAKKAQRKKKKPKKDASKKALPRWFIYVTYAACFLFCGISSWFTILYGLKFEPAIGRAWLLSSTFALFIEMFIQDPLKIVVKTYILTKLTTALGRGKAKT